MPGREDPPDIAKALAISLNVMSPFVVD